MTDDMSLVWGGNPTLNGFFEDISINISDSEQIGNIILTVRLKLEKESIYTIATHREEVEKALSERGYTQDTIDTWIQYIE